MNYQKKDTKEKVEKSKFIFDTEAGMIIGIDLGTTYSAVDASLQADPEAAPLNVATNLDGDYTTPSVFAYHEKEIKIGKEAEAIEALHPNSVVRSIKKYMGKSADELKKIGKEFVIEGREFTPESISAEILSYLIGLATSKENTNKIRKVVISHPAYFTQDQIQATINAALIAGIPKGFLSTINEPTAAAIAYGLKEKNKILLIFDLGGGTFDVSIIRNISEDGNDLYEVLSTAGNNQLGGNDFDNKIVDFLVEEFRKKTGFDLISHSVSDPSPMARIRNAARDAKKSLSSKTEVQIDIPYLVYVNKQLLNLSVSLTRAKFEQMIAPYVKECWKIVQQAISNSNDEITIDKISKVALVGGSTRIPAFVNLLEEKFGKERVISSQNRDLVVAIGAYIRATILSGGTKNITVADVNPIPLGIAVEGNKMAVMIEGNARTPCKKTEIFTTAVDNQSSVRIEVYQGPRPLASDNRFIGSFDLLGIKPAPRGIPKIEVEFSVDSSGVMDISAKDKDTGIENKIQIKGKGLTEEEIQKMKKEAEENREADQDKIAKIDLLNTASNYLYTFDSQLKELEKNPDSAQDPQFAELKNRCDNLRESIEKKDYEEVRKHVDNINDLMAMFGEQMKKQKENNPNDNSESPSDSNTDSDPEDKESL